MRIIGIEEHSLTGDTLRAWQALDPQWQDLGIMHASQGEVAERLQEIGPRRIADMDRIGLDVQVVSPHSPGVQNLAPADAVVRQREDNDWLLAAIDAGGGRLQGLATLATPDPERAAEELQRTVGLGLDGAMLFGRTRERTLDDPFFSPILEAAQALRVPLYIHPQTPLAGVREAYYNRLGDDVEQALATHGIGWHYESGMELLRLIFAGVLDRFPDLQLIVGHWGEVVLFYLERVEQMREVAALPRTMSEYVRSQVHVTAGGLLSQRYRRWAREVVGPDRLLFATDYPFVHQPDGAATTFLREAELSDDERTALACGNWERLRDAIRR